MRTAQGEVGAAIPVRQAISRNVLCASVSIDAKGPRRLSGGAAWIKLTGRWLDHRAARVLAML